MERRSFLKGSVAAAVAVALNPLASLESLGRPKPVPLPPLPAAPLALTVPEGKAGTYLVSASSYKVSGSFARTGQLNILRNGEVLASAYGVNGDQLEIRHLVSAKAGDQFTLDGPGTLFVGQVGSEPVQWVTSNHLGIVLD